MAKSLLKWTDNDKQNLKKAIINFNSKIKRLEKLGYTNLPDRVNYKDLKVGRKEKFDEFGNLIEYRMFPILSRNELERTIKELKDFSKKDSEKLITLKSGEQITNWEYQKLKKELKKAKSNITREINYINDNRLVRGLGQFEKQSLEATYESISSVYKKSGYEFKRVKKLIYNKATSDSKLRKAITFRENLMYAIDELEGYEGKEELIKILNKYQNPLTFYEIVSSSEMLMDLFLYYREEASSQIMGGFNNNQEAFTYSINEIKEAIEERKSRQRAKRLKL